MKYHWLCSIKHIKMARSPPSMYNQWPWSGEPDNDDDRKARCDAIALYEQAGAILARRSPYAPPIDPCASPYPVAQAIRRWPPPPRRPLPRAGRTRARSPRTRTPPPSPSGSSSRSSRSSSPSSSSSRGSRSSSPSSSSSRSSLYNCILSYQPDTGVMTRAGGSAGINECAYCMPPYYCEACQRLGDESDE